MLLPYVMRYHLKVRQAAFARVARLLGEDTSGLSEPQAAERAITAIERLNRAIGIPARLRDLGAKEEQIPEIAEKALAIQRIIRVNPRVPTVPEVIELLHTAY
jgi:alcohol dehydrogenase class IV